MTICSNINYCYRQTAQSNFIKKSTEITAAIAFYTFHTAQYAILVPVFLTSFIIAAPAVIIDSKELLGLAFVPSILLSLGIDYIEDIGIKISQIAIDRLGIPVQLSISRIELDSILANGKPIALQKKKNIEKKHVTRLDIFIMIHEI